MSAIINSIRSLVYLVLYTFTLQERFLFFLHPPALASLTAILSVCVASKKVDRYKHPPRKLYKDMVCKSFLIYVVGRLFGVFLFTLSVSLF